jgi:hypothetical protein
MKMQELLKKKTTEQTEANHKFTFSDAVASFVPLASNAIAANGLSWAGIMLTAFLIIELNF